MEINKKLCDFAGIYAIKNSINGKLYVGKSKNCYKRLHQHLTDIKTDNRNYNENPHLLNAFKKYGEENFECYILEKINEDDIDLLEKILAEKELYWMKELDSLNRDKGYNLRWDSQGKCFCSEETSIKISNRLKKEWEDGIRDDHSNKMKDYWSNNEERKKQQREIMSKNKTKWSYKIYDPDGNLITESGTYEDLKKLNITSALSAFSKRKCNDIITKKYRVIRF